MFKLFGILICVFIILLLCTYSALALATYFDPGIVFERPSLRECFNFKRMFWIK